MAHKIRVYSLSGAGSVFFRDDAGLIKNDPFNFRPTEINSDSHQCFFCLFVLGRLIQDCVAVSPELVLHGI